MKSSMKHGSPKAQKASRNARTDDDGGQWITTVLASLAERSAADRQALLEALTHGATPGPVSGTIRRNPQNSGGFCDPIEDYLRTGAVRPTA